MKTHFAALTDHGERFRATSRQEIDQWAAKQCKAGRNVDIYVALPSARGPGRTPVLVGKWRQEGVE